MKRKNLDVCEDQVRSAQALNELGTEQCSKLNRVRKKLNRAKRENRITQEEIFEIVQEIAEALIEFRDTEGRRRSKGGVSYFIEGDYELFKGCSRGPLYCKHLAAGTSKKSLVKPQLHFTYRIGDRNATTEMLEKIESSLGIPSHLLRLLAAEDSEKTAIEEDQIQALAVALAELLLHSKWDDAGERTDTSIRAHQASQRRKSRMAAR